MGGAENCPLFTNEKLEEVSCMKRKKVSCPDGMSAEMLHHLADLLFGPINACFLGKLSLPLEGGEACVGQ